MSKLPKQCPSCGGSCGTTPCSYGKNVLPDFTNNIDCLIKEIEAIHNANNLQVSTNFILKRLREIK